MRHFWRSFLAVFVALVLPAAQAQTLEFRAGDFVIASSQDLPFALPGWEFVALPDRWRETRPQADGAGWYRMSFERNALGAGLQAVLVPHASVNAAVYLNGALLGSGGNFDEPMARTWNRPRIYLIPPETLQPGRNTLLVYLKAHRYAQASLYPPKIGPEVDLRREYDQAYFLRITLNQIASILIGVVGLLMLNMWWRRRKDVAYGYFGLSALVWSLQSTNLYVLEPAVNTMHWEILVNASFQVFAALLLISMLRYVGAEWRPLNRLLWTTLVISPVAMAVAPAQAFMQVTSLLHLATLAGALGSLGLLLRSAWKFKNRDALLLLATMGLIVVFALHDWLLHSKHLWMAAELKWLPVGLYLLQYSAPVVFLAIAWIMTVRFMTVLNDFESLNVELDQRVNTKHAQLEQSFERLRNLEREKAAQDERERIHSDLHDDVGAKLLSLVYRAGSTEAADLARSALQDLRDVVSRSGSGSFQLEDVLADIRAECEQRLSAASLSLEWTQPDLLPAMELTQPHALHLGRIVREAISNVIRHSHASTVTVHLVAYGGELQLELCDNGTGKQPEQDVPGRGLRNMQHRAQTLGGTLTRYAAPQGGCCVCLRMPLPRDPTGGN